METCNTAIKTLKEQLNTKPKKSRWDISDMDKAKYESQMRNLTLENDLKALNIELSEKNDEILRLQIEKSSQYLSDDVTALRHEVRKLLKTKDELLCRLSLYSAERLKSGNEDITEVSNTIGSAAIGRAYSIIYDDVVSDITADETISRYQHTQYM